MTVESINAIKSRTSERITKLFSHPANDVNQT